MSTFFTEDITADTILTPNILSNHLVKEYKKLLSMQVSLVLTAMVPRARADVPIAITTHSIHRIVNQERVLHCKSRKALNFIREDTRERKAFWPISNPIPILMPLLIN
jgi:hypothetical protein